MVRRLILMGLGGCLVLLGLVGLLVPILPGVLFLVLAAVCFSATSPRFQARLDRHPAWRGWRLRWRESRGLSMGRRAKLFFWLSADAAMKAFRNR